MTIQTEGPDVEAVIRVLDEETRAFYAKDFEAFSQCWAHEPYIRRLGWWTRGGITNRWGWTDIGDRARRMMLDSPDYNSSAHEFRRESVVVRVSGDMAWATFDEICPDTGDPDFDMPGTTLEARVLERIDGAWRIVYHTYLLQTATPARAPMLRVTKGGKINWMNNAAESALGIHTMIAVASGRLYAVDASQNKRLQQAIADAARRDEKLDGGRAAIPLVLEDSESDEVCVCWILTEGSGSGAVLVALNSLTFAQDQIDAAVLAFGLSPAQQRLAELVVAGKDMVQSSAFLGVSVSTARTQLQRIYDKTGARSQAALVRTLLSATPPVWEGEGDVVPGR